MTLTEVAVPALDQRTRFLLIVGVVVVAALAAVMFVPSAATGAQTITIYKNPSCGCCGSWADQMAAQGFRIKNEPTHNMVPVFAERGIQPAFQGCHLALVGDYVLVGHVPPAEVMRLLESGEDVKGLATPGMPVGSPGMEMPDGRTEQYQVLVLDRDGGVRPLARYQGNTRLE